MTLQPTWLVSGAWVHVLPASSTRAAVRREQVQSVDWPFLVYLEGWPGAVHPSRCSPLPQS